VTAVLIWAVIVGLIVAFAIATYDLARDDEP